MPRKKRRCVPGILYHVISRFVDRSWFIERQHERRYYLDLLGRSLTKSDWRCLAFAVMSNHIHVAIIAGATPLDTWVRPVHAPFADWLNRERDRIGNVFTRGPKSLPIPFERAGHLVAYIHNNPVRAKLVSGAAESTWTSHRHYIGRAPTPRWLHVDEGLALADRGNRQAFDSWVDSGPAHPLYDPARPDETYEDLIASYEQREAAEEQRATDERRTRVMGSVIEATSSVLRLPASKFLSKRRTKPEVVARAVVVRCCDELGYSGAEIARGLGVSPPAILKLRQQPTRHPEIIALSHDVLRKLPANGS